MSEYLDVDELRREWGNATDGSEFAEFLVDRITQAVDLAVKYGGIDGAHHKDWVIDQIVRKLSGKQYTQVVRKACDGPDGPDTYSWETGVAP